jgi:hypothetical protein
MPGNWVVEIGGRMPRIEAAGDICLRRPRPTQECRAEDDDDNINIISNKFLLITYFAANSYTLSLSVIQCHTTDVQICTKFYDLSSYKNLHIVFQSPLLSNCELDTYLSVVVF